MFQPIVSRFHNSKKLCCRLLDKALSSLVAESANDSKIHTNPPNVRNCLVKERVQMKPFLCFSLGKKAQIDRLIISEKNLSSEFFSKTAGYRANSPESSDHQSNKNVFLFIIVFFYA